MTLSGLLCATLDDPGALPEHAFELYDEDDTE